MNRNQKIILTIGVVLLITLIVHPPYFGIDRDSGGKLHAFIGYHWIWDAPSAPDVYERLTNSDATGVDPLRLESFEARINTVRLIQNVVVLGAAVALGMAFLRKRAKAPNAACS
jgi:hypothetical protein